MRCSCHMCLVTEKQTALSMWSLKRGLQHAAVFMCVVSEGGLQHTAVFMFAVTESGL